ncbi:cold-shock protein [Plasmodium cynomolgi strain B]|uniref:Cold-shock protein n=1 Tax=Plasmodium cynomolgi (strain B) TaxID=1120755 RepID=K6UI15_PLACD|nr:cold-shock protein [Plasmodium cynomolgi strain B]GAB64578.1 cold-shock protein [Plasmodium cynomolgi strain B]
MLQRKPPKGLFLHFMERRLLSGLLDKEKASRMTGSVIKFDRRKGYGFISEHTQARARFAEYVRGQPNDGGPDIFVHYTDICQGRTFSLTSEEKKKLSWCSRVDMPPRQVECNFENYDPPGSKEQIKKEFKYLVPGERVKFYVTYDQHSHSTKATSVDYLD